MTITADNNAKPAKGRSLWDDAKIRLLSNRAAVTSLITLCIITLACFIGPYLTGHQFDTVYKNYVKVPASLEAYPREHQIIPALEKVLKRARVEVENIDVASDKVEVAVRSQNSEKKLDERIVRYLDR